MSGTELIMGMEELVQHIRELEKQNKQLQQEKKELLVMLNEKIQETNEAIDELTQENEDNLASLNFYTQQNDVLKDERKQLQEEIKELKKEQLTEENAIQYVYENTDLYDDWVKGSTAYKELQGAEWEENKRLKKELDEENGRSIELIEEKKKLREENRELEMKGNARKDIIRNMFECITADIEEVEDGFYIKRDWGHKYIDKWNEIVSQEYQDALKDINEELEGIEWVTDGYQFDLNIVEEDHIPTDSDEEEEEEQDNCEMIAGFFPVRKGSHIHHNLATDGGTPQRFTLGDRMKTTYKDEVADNSLMRRICVLDENDKMSKKNVIVANAFAIFTREGDDEMYYICRNNNSRGPLQVRNIINKVKVDVPIPPEFLKDLKLASRPLGDNKTRVSAILKGGGCAIVDVESSVLIKDFPDWFKGKTGEEVGEYIVI